MKRTEQGLAFIIILFLVCAIASAASAITLAPAPASAFNWYNSCAGDVSYGQGFGGSVPYASFSTSNPVGCGPATSIRVVDTTAGGQLEGTTCGLGANGGGCSYSYVNGVGIETAVGSTFGTAFGLESKLCKGSSCQPTQKYSAWG